MKTIAKASLFIVVLVVQYPVMGQTQEFSFDDGVGAQVLALSKNDTIAVYFNGASGYIIDSVRVAFNKAGGMTFGLWRYTGVPSSPIGSSMTSTFTIPVAQSDVNSPPTTVGTTKWVKKDLASLNLSANPSFVVAGIVDSLGVLVSKVPVTGTEHSIIYTTGQWAIRTTGSDVYRCLIRVYAHIPAPVGVEVVELVPSFFLLKQNYPNPFNSQTQIEYEIPVGTSGAISLEIFNVLGEKVKSFIQGERAPGRYVEHWDGADGKGEKLGSGLYIYRLIADGRMTSKKMLLVK